MKEFFVALALLAGCSHATADTSVPAPAPAAIAPASVAALEVRSQDVTAGSSLSGTYLSATSGQVAPQVLILVGSGPTDRDGNGPLGLRSDSYKLLAEGLSAAGIGTTRVDKRGMFASAAGAADANSVYISQLAEDAHLWAKDIKQRTGAPCVWLLGHSEGGLVALQAAQNPTDICGLILVASPGRKAGDVLREQFSANPANAPILPDALASITALEGGQDVDVTKMHPALQNIFAPAIQGFLKSLLKLDPSALIAAYREPILIVQGTTDLQVTMADARVLATAQPRAQLVEIEGMNHVLKSVGSDRGANLATYANPALPITPELVTEIAAFVKEK
jgi:uncharacterized protein